MFSLTLVKTGQVSHLRILHPFEGDRVILRLKSIKVFISHQSYFIKHCPCHTRFSCFRVTHYLCSCCPRNYFSQNCMKDRNRQYKKYQHIDEDRQNLNHSQVPLSLVFIYNRGQLKKPDITGALYTFRIQY